MIIDGHGLPKMPNGESPIGYWQSPGRVNLIGEFTDYNLGFVLPFAIDRRVYVGVQIIDEPLVRVTSREENESISISYSDLQSGVDNSWASYVFGTIWAFRSHGIKVPGLELSLHSSIPIGAGLSSSAAIEAAVATALNDITESDLGLAQLAKLCHSAESDYVGAPVGIMDQMAVLNGQSQKAMFMDCRENSVQYVPFNANELLIVDTRLRHSNNDGNYARNRQLCERAADQLGITSLRDANLSMVEETLRGDLRRVARHVVTENLRVIESVDRLSNARSIGDLLVDSHRSLQKDFMVTCPELDCIVEVAITYGAEGARMFGAGLGGCALVLGGDHERIASHITAEFQYRGYQPPHAFAVTSTFGAGAL